MASTVPGPATDARRSASGERSVFRSLFGAYPDALLEAAIIMLRAGTVAERTARAVAAAVGAIRTRPLAKPPGISEAVEWANAATVLEKGGSPWPEAFRRAIGVLIKDEEDLAYIAPQLDAIVEEALA